jgi:hypothetical protein
MDVLSGGLELRRRATITAKIFGDFKNLLFLSITAPLNV